MKSFWTYFLVFTWITLSLGTIAVQANQNRQTVYIISLKGEIFDGLARRVTKKLRRVDTNKARALVLEIDTPGGGVGYVLDICKEIDRIAQAGVPVYAYINGYAWSGGALVSLACDRIYMVKQSSIGSAQVKILTPFGIKDADEKSLSAMRAHFRAYAEHRSYPKTLAEAMVDPAMEVREIHYRGERFFKTSEEIIKMRGRPDIDSSQLIDRGVVVAAGKLANFTAEEAKKFGFCKAVYQTRDELLKGTALAGFSIEELKTTTEDSVANFLTHKWVRFFLIAFGILGLLIEFWTPGFGIPGILGLTCFSLFFLGGYLAETAAVWEILIFIFGLALLALEIFVIPGFGIAGVLGIILCFIGLLLSFQTFILPESEAEVNIFMGNIFDITFSIGLDIFTLLIITRFLPESAPLRRLSVATVQRAEEGYSVAISGLAELVGKEGVALCKLRPAGRVEIENEPYDVVTQGDFINQGENIKVLEVRGNRITVVKV